MSQLCQKCQTENITTAKFCKKCGSPLGGVQARGAAPSQTLSDIEKRALEEKLYEQVALDLKNGIKKEGLYTKALVDANGSEELANVLYIKYAVQSLKDELTLKAEAERAIQIKILDEERQRQTDIKKRIGPAGLGEISSEMKEQIQNDGFTFLSKSVVRKNGTWDDYNIRTTENEVLLIDRESGSIIKEYYL